MRPILFFSLLAGIPGVLARFQNDFSSYPSGAIDCLYQSSNSSGCNGATVKLMNACLCANGGNFLTNTAKCMGTEHSDDLGATYSVLNVNCQGTGSGLAITQSNFIAAANVSNSSTDSTSTATASSDSTSNATSAYASASSTADASSPTSSSKSESGGLPNAAIIGAGAGLALAGIIAGVIILSMFLRRRAQQKRAPRGDEAANPMLFATGDVKGPAPPPSAWGVSPVDSSMGGIATWDPTQASTHNSPLPSAYMVNGQWVQGSPYGYPHPHPHMGDVRSVNVMPVEAPAIQTIVYELDSTVIGPQEMPGSQELIHPRAKQPQK